MSLLLSIIGHGTSPKGKGWGSRIDENVVIRLKNPSWQEPEDYGKRVDYMVSSTETMPVMLDYQRKPKEYWAQPKRGKWAVSIAASFCSRTKAPLRIPLDIHNKWNGDFLTWITKENQKNIGRNQSVGYGRLLSRLPLDHAPRYL